MFKRGIRHNNYVNYFLENYCIHCSSKWDKGLDRCEDCHMRLRIVPRNYKRHHGYSYEDRVIMKEIHKRAKIMLAMLGYKLPPARYSAAGVCSYRPGRAMTLAKMKNKTQLNKENGLINTPCVVAR